FRNRPPSKEGVDRNGGDPHLIWYQPENSGDFVTIAGRNSLESQIAGIEIEIRQRRECFASFDVKRQQVRNLSHQLNRVVAIEKTTRDGLIGNGEYGRGERPHSRFNCLSLRRNQTGDPLRQRRLAAARRKFVRRRLRLLALIGRQKRAQALRHHAAFSADVPGQRPASLEVVHPSRNLVKACERLIDKLGAYSERTLSHGRQ